MSLFCIESNVLPSMCHPQASTREEIVIIQLISIANNKSHRESLIIINTPYSWRRQQSKKFCFSIAKPQNSRLLLLAWWVLSRGCMLAKSPPCLGPEPILPQQTARAGKPWEAPSVPPISALCHREVVFLLKLPVLLLMVLRQERAGRSGAVWVANSSVVGSTRAGGG